MTDWLRFIRLTIVLFTVVTITTMIMLMVRFP